MVRQQDDTFGNGMTLSSDGSIVAIGAGGNDGNGNNSGHVRIFQYQVISGTATWTQLGQDIDGEAAVTEVRDFLYHLTVQELQLVHSTMMEMR